MTYGLICIVFVKPIKSVLWVKKSFLPHLVWLIISYELSKAKFMIPISYDKFNNQQYKQNKLHRIYEYRLSN